MHIYFIVKVFVKKNLPISLAEIMIEMLMRYSQSPEGNNNENNYFDELILKFVFTWTCQSGFHQFSSIKIRSPELTSKHIIVLNDNL